MFIRLWGNNFLTQLINMRHGTTLTDSQNGLRSMRLDLLREIDLQENKHTIELEMVLMALKRGLRVTQVREDEYERRAGRSTLSLVKQTPHFLWCLLRNIFQIVTRLTRRLFLAGLVGVPLLVLDVA